MYDPETQTWKRRYGFGGATDDKDEWIIPAKDTDVADGTDPWMRKEAEKKERVQKQVQKERSIICVTVRRKRGRIGISRRPQKLFPRKQVFHCLVMVRSCFHAHRTCSIFGPVYTSA